MGNFLNACRRAAALSREDPLGFSRRSYAQEGEDLQLLEVMGDARPGAFVDVGAYHPFRYSNTYLLYTMGWRGLNIDATPGSMEAFRKYRPGDTNVEAAVSAIPQELKFFIMDEGQMNTFDPALAKVYTENKWSRELRRQKIMTHRLADLLAKYWTPGKRIDFMNIDVEGHDLDVIASNDWDLFRPLFLAVEDFHSDVRDVLAQPLAAYLEERNYAMVARGRRTCIFRLKDPNTPAARSPLK